jgi:hypothetical protein
MSKVTDARIAAIKALFGTGSKLTEDNFAALIDAIQEAAQEHQHVSGGGAGSGTGDAAPLYTIGAFVWIIPGTLETGASQGPRLRCKPDITFLEAELLVKGAPTEAAIIVDINKNGTSLWADNQGNRPQIAAGETEGESTSFDTATATDDDVLIPDIDQVGAGDPGETLAVMLWYKQYAVHDS